MTRLQRQIAFLVGICGILWGIAALWWWALWGMSDDVATTNLFTVVFLSSSGFLWAAYPGNDHE